MFCLVFFKMEIDFNRDFELERDYCHKLNGLMIRNMSFGVFV